MALATIPDVEARLGRSLEESERARADGLIAEASALVAAYCGQDFADDEIPDNVRIVTSRMVARALTAGDGPDMPVESMQRTAGPFSMSANYSTDAQGGGPWLTRQDKMLLGSWRMLDSVPLTSEHTR